MNNKFKPGDLVRTRRQIELPMGERVPAEMPGVVLKTKKGMYDVVVVLMMGRRLVFIAQDLLHVR